MPTMSLSRSIACVPLPPPGEVYRITVDLYERLIETGDIAEDQPIELLDGVLVRKMPKGPRHETSSALCRRALERNLPDGWHVRIEGSLRIPDHNEPDPDLTVVRGELLAYTDQHPGPADVGLVIEIAESSLARDRGSKRDIYACAGVPTYWTVNSRSTAALKTVATIPRQSSVRPVTSTWSLTDDLRPGSPSLTSFLADREPGVAWSRRQGNWGDSTRQL